MANDEMGDIAKKMGEISAIIDCIFKKGTKEDLMIDLFARNDELKKMVDLLE